MIQQQNYSYEILILDRLGKSEITTVKSLSKALGYSEKLWEDANIRESVQETVIEDAVSGVTLKITKLDSAADETVFLLNAKSTNFEKIEPFRQRLLHHVIQKLGFVNAKIVADSVSEKISQSIYPLIKDAENGLRKRLNKLLTQKSGSSWLEQTASKATLDKLARRKSLSNPFDGLLDSQVSLTDFDDILDLVQKSSLNSQTLKANLDTLAVLRDKVLTYVPLVKEDYNTAHKVAKEVLAAIGEDSALKDKYEEPLRVSNTPNPATQATVQNAQAASKPQEHVAPKEEPVAAKEEPAPRRATVSLVSDEPVVTAVKSEVGASTYEAPKSSTQTREEIQVLEEKRKSDTSDFITESVFLSELKQAEGRQKGSYVSLKSFVTEVLGEKGYATGPAYTLSRTLSDSGKVTIYDIKDNIGLIVKAIRSN
ncbi:MAG TPA: hypothetical protein VL947_13020 [Cytophagales bacterium]|nr:hypothetical protein [Cytophagales bacterium]